jgi:hypothetical protein
VTVPPRHVSNSAIVLDEVELLYVPVPKAGSTTMLWALLELVELRPDDFRCSVKLEATRALTIHDMTIWGSERRLAGRPADDVLGLFDDPDWLTFTIVRDPVPRIWSAWVSKILLHDPRFVAAYEGEEWFPEPPRSAREMINAFRGFVEVLTDRPEDLQNAHWSSQADLIGLGELGYDVVGRVEDLGGVLQIVDAHLRARGRDGLTLGRENPSLFSFVPEVLDPESWERCAVATERDRDAFGYELVPRTSGEPDGSWVADLESRIWAIQAIIERNERIEDLTQLVTRSHAS